MNSALIANFNNRVKPEDTVYHIGDYCFRNSPGGKKGEGSLIKPLSFESLMNGKIIFLKGNHDAGNNVRTCIKNITINLGGIDIFMTHKPKDFNSDYILNLVGHVHTDWDHKIIDNTLLVNVGVDVNKFIPISIEDIFKKYGKIIHELKHKRKK